jgi:hypothetical protein
MNWAKGLKRITLLIAITAATVGGIYMGMIPIRKYYNAQNQFGVSDPNGTAVFFWDWRRKSSGHRVRFC